MSSQQYVELPGSMREQRANSRRVGKADAKAQIEVSVYLRPQSAILPATTYAAQTDQARQLLSREQLAQQAGADPADIAAVQAFAQANGLTVAAVEPARRLVKLSGTVAAMSRAFHVELNRYSYNGNTFRGRVGMLQVPADLTSIVVGVFGLDDRPQAKPHFRLASAVAAPKPKGIFARIAALFGWKPKAAPAASARVTYTPTQLGQVYSIPPGDGSGQCIALIELGGGYSDADLQAYFQQLGVKAPQVSSVSVDGATNSPTGDPNSADGEVELDIEIAGGIAPGARIVVYFAPNTDQGFIDAITNAIHDTTNKPTLMSISWGGPESSWTAQAVQAMDMAFQAAASIGMTIFVASGDNGSDDGAGDGSAHVDFPASSPHVVACGGTSLPGPTSESEVVWNDPTGGATGGGVSDLFDLPSWQSGAGVPVSVNASHKTGRGVPDVAGDADPATGYDVLIDGSPATIGGTSAVAPLWAGIFAVINAQLPHPVGFANPVLYQQLAHPTPPEATPFHDITSGDNSAAGAPGYNAGSGWDACTGLGSPIGTALLADLASIIGKNAVTAPVSAPDQTTP